VPKVNRNDLLHRLLSAAAGLTRKEVLQQSSCFVLKKGRAYTFNQEINCSVPTGLDSELVGAVPAAKLLELLKRLPDDEVEVGHNGKSLSVKGGGGRASRLAVEAEVLLPVDLPPAEFPRTWIQLHENFAEAADLTSRCTKKKCDQFARTCVHALPDCLEATDNARMLRYPVKTFLAAEALIRGSTLKEMVQLGMTHGCATPNWLHFKNPLGLRMSLLKFAPEGYPNCTPCLERRGTPVRLPGGLAQAAELAGLFEDEDGSIRIEASGGLLTVTGENAYGDYTEPKKMTYEGPDLKFGVPPKLLAELVEHDTAVEIGDGFVRIATPRYTFVAALEVLKPHERLAAARKAAEVYEQPEDDGLYDQDVPF
jgi:hypothetical protein